MAAYDKHRFVFAHIPSARECKQPGPMTNAEIIRDYRTWFTRQYHYRPMINPTGYLLTSTLMPKDNSRILREWFKDLKTPFIESLYEPDLPEASEVEGEFLLSRKGDLWFPKPRLMAFRQVLLPSGSKKHRTE